MTSARPSTIARAPRGATLALLMLSSGVAVRALPACGSEVSGISLPDAAETPGEVLDGGTEDSALPATNDAGADVIELPVAKGDPCRGTPLPLDQHFVAKGTCARLVASTELRIRQLAFAPNGDLFGATFWGEVVLLRDENGDGVFSTSEIHLFGTNQTAAGNSVHVDAAGGHLYVGTWNSVRRWPYSPTALAAPGNPEDVVVGIPEGGIHSLHTAHVYAGWLYVHAGLVDNQDGTPTFAYDTERSLLRRFKLSSFSTGKPLTWAAGENVAIGLRNLVGFTRSSSGRLFGVVNGLDDTAYEGEDIHEDNPGEQVVELSPGKRYGFPYCFTAQRVVVAGAVLTPGRQLANDAWARFHDDAWCESNSDRPATFVQAHSAPLDIAFFDAHPKGALPERWRGGAFISLHGSFDRSISTGYKVVFMPFDGALHAPTPTSTTTSTAFPYETVFGGGTSNGPVDGKWTWSAGGVTDTPRPVGVAISPVDGALYISNDEGGQIYRVGLTGK